MTYDVQEKLNKCTYICETTNNEVLKNKTRKDMQIKFYKTTAVPTPLKESEK